LYVHDRKTGATSQIGMGSADPATVIHSIEPDFSDTGLLVYASDEPNLADDDSDIDYDVFVFNLVTGGHTRVQLTHEGAAALSSARAPAISSDGRYVAFMGIDGPLDGIQWWNVYGVDRESGTSYDVSVT